MKVDVRTVLYTDDFEPITVLELPASARGFLEEHGLVRLAVPTRVQFSPSTLPARYEQPKYVTVWTERFIRHGLSHLFLFTNDDENAMLLRAAFLPGQRRDLRDQRANAFAEGFVHALRTIGQ